MQNKILHIKAFFDTMRRKIECIQNVFPDNVNIEHT